jgi:pyruvate dehydrogenase E2 component (dihydrolipoamide acetyltransferase)
MKDAIIGEWYKKEGDTVEKGEPLLMVETEKITVDIEAPASGVLRKVVAARGSLVGIGEPLGVIAEPNEELQDLSDIAATQPFPQPDKNLKGESLRKQKVNISPRARILAEEHNIDLATIAATGPNGRIVENDVQRAVDQIKSSVPAKTISKVLPMTQMRKTIAERLSHSARTAAHVTIVIPVDATGLKGIAEQLQTNPTDRKTHISFTHIITKVVAKALKEYSIVNSTIHDNEIIIWRDINIGLAVALEEGLIVPVIRDADRKRVEEIAAESIELIEKAKENRLNPEDTIGGTFTITNLGMYGVSIFTPIINPSESAILGVGKITEEAVVENGRITAKPIMHLSLSFDHRVMDGSVAAQFVSRVKQLLEQLSLDNIA